MYNIFILWLTHWNANIIFLPFFETCNNIFFLKVLSSSSLMQLLLFYCVCFGHRFTCFSHSCPTTILIQKKLFWLNQLYLFFSAGRPARTAAVTFRRLWTCRGLSRAAPHCAARTSSDASGAPPGSGSARTLAPASRTSSVGPLCSGSGFSRRGASASSGLCRKSGCAICRDICRTTCCGVCRIGRASALGSSARCVRGVRSGSSGRRGASHGANHGASGRVARGARRQSRRLGIWRLSASRERLRLPHPCRTLQKRRRSLKGF